MKPTLGVISFPGNNCESESIRAGIRNGFDTELILWNEIGKVGKLDAYFLTGGFSYEDRGRSGAIPAREEIFDALREEARKGKVILGVCNGAQMIVESGLIPVDENPLPFSLTDNIRRDENGHVLGTGFYNEWIYLKPERIDTAFTNSVSGILSLPMAHGEGRFTTIDPIASEALESGKNVAFRYCDKEGKVSSDFPTTPNGALFATGMITNKEGTIGAIMPHPERFYDKCDGDQIIQSMRNWIEKKMSPAEVRIGDFYGMKLEEPKKFEVDKDVILLEKKLIITDNEAFSVSSAASKVAGKNIEFEKSILFEISGDKLDQQKILNSGLIFNENKEVLIKTKSENKYAILPFEDDQAKHLEEKLEKFLDKKIKVRILKCWNFGNTDENSVKKVLQNRLLANSNSAEIYKISC